VQRLQGKASIVTGAAHGIGRAIAEVLAEHGSYVLLLDVDATAGEEAATAINAAGGEARFLMGDVCRTEQIDEAVRSLIADAGRVDVLVNNAAYLGTFHGAQEASDEEWQKCIDVNLLGTNRVTRAVLPHMIRQNQGSIVNIVSVQALAACPDSVAYTATKAAMLGHTASVAHDYGRYNIRANSICPGPIRTRISPAPGSAHHTWQLEKTMLGRTGDPREVAYAALFLASDESSYVTAATLAVDGGWAAK
jgi:NAD(P)-dependent dehydrogenase (short-subunit alcohol dehydrogenase family)